MRTVALALACATFATLGARSKQQHRPSARQLRLQNAGRAAPSSHSLADLQRLQASTKATLPNPPKSFKLLALLLLAGSESADAFALHESRLLSGRNQLALPSTKMLGKFRKWSPVMSAAVIPSPRLVLERAPPSPPPIPPNSGGWNGPGGDGGDMRFGLISDSQALEVLDDWIARTRAYVSLSNLSLNASSTTLADNHRRALKGLELLRDFGQRKMDDDFDQTLLLALYASDDASVLALASVEIKRLIKTGRRTVVVKHLRVNPIELNRDSSTVDLNVKTGLRLLAQELGSVLSLPEDHDGE